MSFHNPTRVEHAAKRHVAQIGEEVLREITDFVIDSRKSTASTKSAPKLRQNRFKYSATEALPELGCCHRYGNASSLTVSQVNDQAGKVRPIQLFIANISASQKPAVDGFAASYFAFGTFVGI